MRHQLTDEDRALVAPDGTGIAANGDGDGDIHTTGAAVRNDSGPVRGDGPGVRESRLSESNRRPSHYE